MLSKMSPATRVPDRQPVALVIDDEPSARFTLSQLLQDAGYIVRTASDGLSGLRVLRECAPDLVLTDMLMPGLNGAGVIISAKRERPQARIVAMSGYSQIGHLDFLSIAHGLGASAILNKPFDVEEVVSVCQALFTPSADGDYPGAATSFDRYAAKLATETAPRLENLGPNADALMRSQSSCSHQGH